MRHACTGDGIGVYFDRDGREERASVDAGPRGRGEEGGGEGVGYGGYANIVCSIIDYNDCVDSG